MLGRVSRGRRLGGVGVIVRRQAALGRLLTYKPKRQAPGGHAHFARGMRPIDRRFAGPGKADRDTEAKPARRTKSSPKAKTSSKISRKPLKAQKPEKRPTPPVSETDLKPVQDRTQLQEAYLSARTSQPRAAQADLVLPMSAVTIVRKEAEPAKEPKSRKPTRPDASRSKPAREHDRGHKSAGVQVIKINSYRPMVGVDPITGRSTTLLRDKKNAGAVQSVPSAGLSEPESGSKLDHLRRLARRRTVAGRRLVGDLGRRTRQIVARSDTGETLADAIAEPAALDERSKSAVHQPSQPVESSRPVTVPEPKPGASLVARLKALEKTGDSDADIPKSRPQGRGSRRLALLRRRLGRSFDGLGRRIKSSAIPVGNWTKSCGRTMASAFVRAGQRFRRQSKASAARFRQGARRRRSLGDIPNASAR